MKDNENKSGKIAVIGGDLRQIYAAEALENSGYQCAFCGLDTYRKGVELNEATENAVALLFPVPVMKGEQLNTPFSDERLTPSALTSLPTVSKTLAVGGLFPQEIRELLSGKGYKVLDLCENETFNYLNAIPTAEGAIALAMSHTGVTVNGSSCVITGYGRIGRCLGRRLKALGADVTVFARKERDRAEALADGMTALPYSSLHEAMRGADAVFNTVPETVLFDKHLSALRPNIPIIELASRPGGIDAVAAIRREARVISAQSLPGRVAPVTAGKIIADLLVGFLQEGQI